MEIDRVAEPPERRDPGALGAPDPMNPRAVIQAHLMAGRNEAALAVAAAALVKSVETSPEGRPAPGQLKDLLLVSEIAREGQSWDDPGLFRAVYSLSSSDGPARADLLRTFPGYAKKLDQYLDDDVSEWRERATAFLNGDLLLAADLAGEKRVNNALLGVIAGTLEVEGLDPSLLPTPSVRDRAHATYQLALEAPTVDAYKAPFSLEEVAAGPRAQLFGRAADLYVEAGDDLSASFALAALDQHLGAAQTVIAQREAAQQLRPSAPEPVLDSKGLEW